MDPLSYLNYHYPVASNAARPLLSQQPQESLHHMPVHDVDSMQVQPHPGHAYVGLDPSRTTPHRLSLDYTAGHDIHTHQRSAFLDPRGAGPLKMCCMDESDQYIPSSSDKITRADHRPLDDIFGNIFPSSGWPQAISNASQSSRSGTSCGYPRRASVETYSLPVRPQLDGVLHVPLLAVDNKMRGTGLVVDFRWSDWGIGIEIHGIPMSDLLHGNVSDLESPNQRVLDGLDITHLRLNILWPHYPPFAKVISAFGVDGKSITRAQLGYEVSLAFAEFFYQITSHAILPAQPGPYMICSSRQGSSSPGIKFEQLHLITVRNTSGGEWTAEIRAVSMP